MSGLQDSTQPPQSDSQVQAEPDQVAASPITLERLKELVEMAQSGGFDRSVMSSKTLEAYDTAHQAAEDDSVNCANPMSKTWHEFRNRYNGDLLNLLEKLLEKSSAPSHKADSL